MTAARRPSLGAQLHHHLRYSRDGARATQHRRAQTLGRSLRDLRRLGFRFEELRKLQTKHVYALVAAWKARGLRPSTMKTNMTSLRWLASKLGIAGVVPSNDRLGIPRRHSPGQDRSWRAAAGEAVFAAVKRRSLELERQMRFMREFGLRFKEAATLRVHESDRGAMLWVHRGTKGGRERLVPIWNDAQRALLDEAKAAVGKDQSLTPAELSFYQWRQQAKSIARAVGLNKRDRTNFHSLRHRYGQARYQELTTFQAPCRMSADERAAATPQMRELDRAARQIVAAELGHGRIDVTRVYLGGLL